MLTWHFTQTVEFETTLTCFIRFERYLYEANDLEKDFNPYNLEDKSYHNTTNDFYPICYVIIPILSLKLECGDFEYPT